MSAAAFRSAFARHLRRRRIRLAGEGARRGGRRSLALAALLLLPMVIGILPTPGGPLLTLVAGAALLLGGTAAGAYLAVRREGSPALLARDLDRVLGREDLVAAAAAVAARPAEPGRFGAALLEQAAEEVGALAPDRVGPFPSPPWRLLALAAFVALLAALLPRGGLGILPGFGGGWGLGGDAGGLPTAGGKEGEREEERGEGAAKQEEEEEGAGETEKTPEPAPAGRVASLEVVPFARSYAADGPIHVGAMATGGPGAKEGSDLSILVSVDGGAPQSAGPARSVAAGKRVGWVIDLKEIQGLEGKLGPGRHTVEGLLHDSAGGTVARSPGIEIVVEGGDSGGAQDSPKPEPRPRPKPEPSPSAPEPEPPTPPPPGGVSKGQEPPEGSPPPPPPPSRFEQRVVRPLFGDGAEVKKKGTVLVLDPEGSRGEAPRVVEAEEALVEVRARAEEAARREGVDPRDREAVRRYFEALRRIVETK